MTGTRTKAECIADLYDILRTSGLNKESPLWQAVQARIEMHQLTRLKMAGEDVPDKLGNQQSLLRIGFDRTLRELNQHFKKEEMADRSFHQLRALYWLICYHGVPGHEVVRQLQANLNLSSEEDWLKVEKCLTQWGYQWERRPQLMGMGFSIELEDSGMIMAKLPGNFAGAASIELLNSVLAPRRRSFGTKSQGSFGGFQEAVYDEADALHFFQHYLSVMKSRWANLTKTDPEGE